MKVKIEITDVSPKEKPCATIEIIGGSEEEVKKKLKNKRWWLPLFLGVLTKVLKVKVKEIAVVVPDLTDKITESGIKKRCDFLGITEMQRIVLALFCNNIARKLIANELDLGIDCINTHIRNVRLLIGNYTDKELKELLTCSDETYLLLYYEAIEAHKIAQDCAYQKKSFT